ncbi:unnamed protein product [Ilex paraguariensis]|uniref:Uncharacterized protein n=1 Tax=Ilex paraguariensis TaxID=185542 RepID=A0ABC8USS9_9AQUA
MATTIIEPTRPIAITNPNPRQRVCFSFAAYAKNLIDHLKNSDVFIEQGLNDAEFSTIESTFHFTFPPDLRSILQEGLPIGPGFPNWRASSTQQLEILINLPILGLCREVSRNNFWLESWGERPNDIEEAVNLAKGFLKKAPVLVPVYRYCYIASTPGLAGNPIFYVHGCEIRLWSFDLVGFFQQVEFKMNDGVLRRQSLSNLLNVPAWAATEARRIEFWTEFVMREERVVARGDTRGWWSGNLCLGGCLEEACWRLRDGGWKEDDVREMLMMDGDDEHDHHHNKKHDHPDNKVLRDKEGVVWHVRVLSLRLLRAGWSTEDVVESLGFPDDYENGAHDGESWFDFQHESNSDDQKSSMNQLMNSHSIDV